MSEFRMGDVIEYESERDNRWCREGQAIVDRVEDGIVFAFDTYWGSGMDRHRLTEAELLTAKVEFNLSDFRPVDRNETWADFNPVDRAVVSSQHGLQRSEYVRLGAIPDHATKVENAREHVEECERDLRSAESRLRWARERLAQLEASE